MNKFSGLRDRLEKTQLPDWLRHKDKSIEPKDVIDLLGLFAAFVVGPKVMTPDGQAKYAIHTGKMSFTETVTNLVAASAAARYGGYAACTVTAGNAIYPASGARSNYRFMAMTGTCVAAAPVGDSQLAFFYGTDNPNSDKAIRMWTQSHIYGQGIAQKYYYDSADQAAGAAAQSKNARHSDLVPLAPVVLFGRNSADEKVIVANQGLTAVNCGAVKPVLTTVGPLIRAYTTTLADMIDLLFAETEVFSAIPTGRLFEAIAKLEFN